MRVTNSMLTRKLINQIEKNSDLLSRYQSQAVTGKSFERASDAPYKAAKALEIEKMEDRNNQYINNANDAKTLINEAETALMDINKNLQRIKELSLNAMNGSISVEERESISIEIEQNRNNILSSLNKSFAGKYIFGGHNSYTKPVTEETGVIRYNNIDITTITPVQNQELNDERLSINLGSQIKMTVAYTVVNITGYGDDNLLNVIDGLITDFKTDPLPEADAELKMENINNYFNNILTKISELGGKTNRLDMIQSQLDESAVNIEEKKSNIMSVDYEEAVIKYTSAQTAYDTTLAIGAKVIKPTLLDYLK